MITILRHLSTSLLCAILVLGHAPAWLHVATCDDPSCHGGFCADASCELAFTDPCLVQFSSVNATKCSSCECPSHGHSDSVGAESGPSDRTACEDGLDGEPVPHDSGTCSICQSLAAPCGFLNDFVLPLVSERSCETVVSRPIVVDASPALLLPPLRGPPAIVA